MSDELVRLMSGVNTAVGAFDSNGHATAFWFDIKLELGAAIANDFDFHGALR